jgi:hypothetical protein
MGQEHYGRAPGAVSYRARDTILPLIFVRFAVKMRRPAITALNSRPFNDDNP